MGVVGVGDCDDLVGHGVADELVEPGADRSFRADDGGAELARDRFHLPGLAEGFDGVNRGQQFDGLVADEAQEALLGRGEQMARGSVGLRGEHLHGDHQMRLGERGAGAEVVAVKAAGDVEVVRRKVRGKGEGQAELGGQRSREGAGAEQSDGDIAALAGDGADGLIGPVRAQVALQLAEQGGEVVAGLREIAAEGAHGLVVAAGGAAQPEVDAAGVECVEGAELLGNDKRGVVGQHDAARADAEGAGGAADVADEHGGRRAGEPCDGVMLGQPVAGVAELLNVLCERDGAGDAAARALTGAKADEV